MMAGNATTELRKASSDAASVLPGFEHVNRYWDRLHSVHAAKILPGEYYVTTETEWIVTVLGSCVSACVRDRVFAIGGMNHFMLPSNGAGDDHHQPCLSSGARYGNYAMEHLINSILKHGGSRKNLEVKVFGGGRILSGMTDIGRRNIEFVKNYLRTESLAVSSHDVGGVYPRKVMYDPLSGRVRVKRLRSLHNDTIVEREAQYLRELEREPVEGGIELF